MKWFKLQNYDRPEEVFDISFEKYEDALRYAKNYVRISKLPGNEGIASRIVIWLCDRDMVSTYGEVVQ